MRSIARMSPVGLRRELVRAVRGADGDRERVDLGLLDEIGGLLGIGQQLSRVELALGADAVLLAGLPGLERAEAAELALDRHADRVRHLDDLARDLDVVLVARPASSRPPCSEPSIITLVKPERIDCWQTAGLAPWSWCSTMGMSGYVSTAACTSWRRNGSPAYLRAPAEPCRITGLSVSSAACMIAWICSMLLTLNAGTP